MDSKNSKTYELIQDKETYTLELNLSKDQTPSISFKLLNKENAQYKNSFNYDNLVKLSKAFKICDSIGEIFSLISQKCEKKEVKIYISDKNELAFNFKLPNDKIEEIKLPLERIISIDTKNFASLDKICQKIALLEEKNKFLEKEINELKIENEKLKSQQGSNSTGELVTQGDKILFDVMSEIFYVSKYKLSKDFIKHLDQFGLSEDYRRELFKKFNSKIKKIYDVRTDGDTLIGLMTKVFGKKNVVTFHCLSAEDEILNVQIAYLNGKIEFINNYFNFNDTELYTYGDYQYADGEYAYTSFRSQNSKLYAKIEFDCIYIIFYEQGSLNFVAKIRDNFVNNPVLCIDGDREKMEEFIENNGEDKVSELFNEFETKELNVNDLVIYQMVEE